MGNDLHLFPAFPKVLWSLGRALWCCCVAEVITTARYGSAGAFINKPQVSEVPNSAIGNHIWLELCSVSKLSAHLPQPKRFRTGSKQSLFCWGLRASRQRKQTQPAWANLLCAERGLTAPSWVMPVAFLSLLWLKQGVWGCFPSRAGLWHRQGVATLLWQLQIQWSLGVHATRGVPGLCSPC